MKTRTIIIVSGAITVGACLHSEAGTAAIVALTGHILVWFLHRIEVKLNRLLDDRGIWVSEAEMSE